MWPDRRILDLFHIELPIIQAPMAGVMDGRLVAAVSKAGGLGSLPCAMLSPAQVREQVEEIRKQTRKPINLNFFCHTTPPINNAREAQWRDRLALYYREMSLDPGAKAPSSNRAPFDAALCDAVIETRPDVVSFHFGLPEKALFDRVRQAGCKVVSSATTVAEARWLAERGVDAIIAQGFEAGGHRGMFLTEDVASQVGIFALLPQIVDAVALPVIAAGAIADARGIAAAGALGAAAVQVGSAYLLTPEATTSPVLRAAIAGGRDDGTAITNLMTGRPARGFYNRVMREIGLISDSAPAFPLAGGALAPLRAKAEAQGSGDFTPLWAGQAAPLARNMPAGELTRLLAEETTALLQRLAR